MISPGPSSIHGEGRLQGQETAHMPIGVYGEEHRQQREDHYCQSLQQGGYLSDWRPSDPGGVQPHWGWEPGR